MTEHDADTDSSTADAGDPNSASADDTDGSAADGATDQGPPAETSSEQSSDAPSAPGPRAITGHAGAVPHLPDDDMGSRRAYRAHHRANEATAAASGSRAGRNLPAAIGVGVLLGAIIIASLIFWKPGFVILVTVVVLVGAWELIEALTTRRIQAPVVPVLLGAGAIVPVAYLGGGTGLAMAVMLSVALIVVWRALDGTEGAVRDIAGGVFIIMYVCLLAGLAALMLREDDGVGRIFVFLIITVVSDIGGYAVGVLAGKHPMAPSVSPKKSWEGFAGSVLCCMVAGAITVSLILDGPWWGGALLGVAVAAFATVGDLAESTIKRDLGIKDMGSILPGHGGVMDRLDSLVATVPVTWMLLYVLVPV